MPYQGEFASGESLPEFTQSESVRRFQGMINIQDATEQHALPATVGPRGLMPNITRVIAIDGSHISSRVKNGYPGAEAALLRIAAIVLDIEKVRNPGHRTFLSPKEMRDLERCSAVDAVIPGRNVTEKGRQDDSPIRFFRRTIWEILQGRLEQNHETLLDTMITITSTRKDDYEIMCPVEDCERKVSPDPSQPTICPCEEREPVYPTDSLRLQERFEENGHNGQVYTLVRQVTEQLVLMNILRYFDQHGTQEFIDHTAFIIDGPLAIYGMPAWLKPYLQAEVVRIHDKFRQNGHLGLLLFGIEKGGEFLEHLRELDQPGENDSEPPIPNKTVLAPDTQYIHHYIIAKAAKTKDYGKDTYYSRKLLYKNATGQHSVITTPMINDASQDLSNCQPEAFPRLGNALELMDELSSYLYQDSFAPLVRAHAHAAIPIKVGTRILSELLPHS